MNTIRSCTYFFLSPHIVSENTNDGLDGASIALSGPESFDRREVDPSEHLLTFMVAIADEELDRPHLTTPMGPHVDFRLKEKEAESRVRRYVHPCPYAVRLNEEITGTVRGGSCDRKRTESSDR